MRLNLNHGCSQPVDLVDTPDAGFHNVQVAEPVQMQFVRVIELRPGRRTAAW